MAHTFVKAEKYASLGLGMLQRELVLPRLVTRYNANDFIGAENDTVKVKIPSLLAAREYGWRNNRSSPIVVDDLVEQTISVTLDTHVYSAVQITDEELTLDIASFGTQVAQPQIDAVKRHLESGIANVMENATFAHSVNYDPNVTDIEDDESFFGAAVNARKHLNNEEVPADGRILLLGSNVAARAVRSEHLVKVNEAGSESALRNAIIGRIAGFTVVEVGNSIDPDFAVAYHPTAFAFANLAPAVPSGAAAGATGGYDGFALRWIRDYDAPYLRDRSVYSSFAGYTSVEDGRILDESDPNFGDLRDENVRAVEVTFGAGS